MVYYDIETLFIPTDDERTSVFKAILICAQITCGKCERLEIYNSTEAAVCPDEKRPCGPRTVYFEGLNCENEFISYLLNLTKKNKKGCNLYCVAFNSSRFDLHLLIPALLDRSDLSITGILKRNSVIISLSVEKCIIFKDLALY